jgi:hypothetical protein
VNNPQGENKYRRQKRGGLMHEITNQRKPHLQANCTLAPRRKKERKKESNRIHQDHTPG